MSMILKDSFKAKDKISNGLWAKTQIIGGYDFYKDKNGISQLGEVVFETTNMVPLAGVQFAFEQIFGVSHKNLHVPTLHEKPIKVGNTGNIQSNVTLDTNDIENSSDILNAYGNRFPHPFGEHVCLFGIGCGGNEENNISVKEVKYGDYQLDGMVPFRHIVRAGSTDALTDAERKIYFGKVTTLNTNYNSYFFKKIDTAEVKHIIKDSDGTEVVGGSETTDPYNTATPITEGIESYLEAKLIIDKKDVREWFNYNGNIEMTRINSIGLFSAYRASGSTDYSNVRLFSKLNIPNEPLSLTKSMTILYRVYGA